MDFTDTNRATRKRLRLFLTPGFLSVIVFVFVFLLPATAWAQGGPPFRTDDPETPGNRHWEINFGWIGDRNPATGAYQVPDFDINYGLGDRIQLKYEIPIAIEETRPQPLTRAEPAGPGSVIGGLGESLLGIKWRFFEHHVQDQGLQGFGTGLPTVFGHHGHKESPTSEVAESAESRVKFSVSTYPQLFLNNPTRAVERGLVAAGPSFFFPIEVNGRVGPIRLLGEVGYNFGNHSVPQSWGRGVLVGHEFSDRTEAYIELYDVQDANHVAVGQGVGQFATGYPKQRETTLGLGGRRALNKAETLNLLLMAGRSFQMISASNAQPSWIGYVGIQVLLGPKEPVIPQVEQRLPNEGNP
jgi:hypothetical protein